MTVTQLFKNIGGFEILGQLGQGGMGIVYWARDHTLQRDLAIKVQSGDWKRHPQMLERFLREAQILAGINHPHVVQIYSVGEHEGAPFFAMELLDSSIADALRANPPSLAQLKRWTLEAARGLAAIHESGVIHRDIKPGNLLLTKPTSLEPEHVKVADLGIASARGKFNRQLTRSGAVVGTSGYLAPESFRLEQELDHRADQYSLGVVFFELLTQRSPYEDMGDEALLAAVLEPRTPPDPRQFRPELDAATSAIVCRMLSDEPDGRFENTPALVQALMLAQDEPEPEQARASPASPARPSVSARPQAPLPSAPTPPQAFTPTLIAPPRLEERTSPLKGWVGISLLVLVLASSAAALRLWNRPAPPAATAADPADTERRKAWAKYLLARYHLISRADEKAWTLNLKNQREGVLQAELTGAEAQAIALTGHVAGQRTEMMDGEEWDIYEVRLVGDQGRMLDLRIEMTETETAGEGFYLVDGQRKRFDVDDSTDH